MQLWGLFSVCSVSVEQEDEEMRLKAERQEILNT
jgi:hypothetical protein